MNWMTSNTPADKSACQQSHTKQYSQLAAACDQSNFRHLLHHYPIRQGSLIKFGHNNSLRWSGQASEPTFIVIPCSVTQSVELQHEMDAAVSPLQVACVTPRVPRSESCSAFATAAGLYSLPRFRSTATGGTKKLGTKCWPAQPTD